MPGPDFGHTRTAQQNRAVKAARLALHLHALGITADRAATLEPKARRQAERDAGVPRSSDETWTVALGNLRARPPRLERDRPPGCACTANEHGVLYEDPPRPDAPYEYSGWPCRCPTPPAGAILCTRGGKQPTAADLAAVDAFAAQLRDHRPPPAYVVTPASADPTDVAAAAFVADVLNGDPTVAADVDEAVREQLRGAWWDV